MTNIKRNIITYMVIELSIFENTVITNIYQPATVFSKKGRKALTENRPYWGLSFCIDGQITYTHNKKRFVSHSKCAVLLPKGATYSINGDKEGLFPVINFDCYNLSADTLIIFPLSDTKTYIKNYHALSNCFIFGDKKLRQFQLLYNILESLDYEQSQTPLSSITAYLEDNFSDHTINNEFLADKLGISEVYLRKLFLANLGSTPKQYILDLRIKKAKQLLTDSNDTVTSISEKCGFSSLYHFCRIFKEKTGLTPLAYSKKYKIFEL